MRLPFVLRSEYEALRERVAGLEQELHTLATHQEEQLARVTKSIKAERNDDRPPVAKPRTWLQAKAALGQEY